MKKNINKHSFARRLTRWLMLVLFVMMAGLAYLIYEVVKMSMMEIVALNFHDIMELSEKKHLRCLVGCQRGCREQYLLY